MKNENGTNKELPDEPLQEPDIAPEGEKLSDEHVEGMETEQEAPLLPEEQPALAQVTSEEETLSGEQADKSDATPPAPTPSDTEPSDKQDGSDTEQETVSQTDEQDSTALPAPPLSDVEQEIVSQADEQDSTAVDAQTPGPTTSRQGHKYTRWFQVLAVVVLICVIGGVVLAIQTRPVTSSHQQQQVTQLVPTPTPPLQITDWCVTSSAPVNAQADQVSLNKVVAISSNDAWLLGSISKGNSFTENTGRTSALLEHWNGKAWSVVPTADTSALLKQLLNKIGGGPASEDVDLNDIAILSANNIWAVGAISVTNEEPVSFSSFTAIQLKSTGEPLIEHWDGQTWQIVAHSIGASVLPDFLAQNQLTSIAAISANDIWATGTQAQPTTFQGDSVLPGKSVPLLEHWNGTNWTEKKLPPADQNADLALNNIQALSSNDVWSFSTNSIFFQSVGSTFLPFPPSGTTIHVIEKAVVASPTTYSPHLLHWNGQNWSEVQLSSTLSKHFSLQNVAVISDTNIWAIGANSNMANKQDDGTPAIYHWNGRVWNHVVNPPGVDAKSSLNTISVIGPDNLWLLGSTDKNQPLLEHWDGQSWSWISPASPTYGAAMEVAVAGNSGWMLSSVYSSSGFSATTGTTALETNCA
jgi:hypothetical protein